MYDIYIFLSLFWLSVGRADTKSFACCLNIRLILSTYKTKEALNPKRTSHLGRPTDPCTFQASRLTKLSLINTFLLRLLSTTPLLPYLSPTRANTHTQSWTDQNIIIIPLLIPKCRRTSRHSKTSFSTSPARLVVSASPQAEWAGVRPPARSGRWQIQN